MQSKAIQHLAVVMGGYSAEREISLQSGAMAMKHLASAGYKVYEVILDEKEWYGYVDQERHLINKDDFSLGGIVFDAVFVAVHGTPGEDGLLQAYFKLLDIPHTTCSSFEAALTFNKVRCNALLSAWKIPVAKSEFLPLSREIDEDEIIASLGLPCFVKPNRAGSSFGVSKVKSSSELLPAIRSARVHDEEVVVESFLDGVEVTCGVMDLYGKIEALPITEIVSENEFFDYQAKYEGASQEITPARISEEATEKIKRRACEIYELLSLRGVVRCDFIYTKDEAYLIEVNTVPGLTEGSLVPQQVIEAGYNLADFFQAMVLRALRTP